MCRARGGATAAVVIGIVGLFPAGGDSSDNLLSVFFDTISPHPAAHCPPPHSCESWAGADGRQPTVCLSAGKLRVLPSESIRAPGLVPEPLPRSVKWSRMAATLLCSDGCWRVTRTWPGWSSATRAGPEPALKGRWAMKEGEAQEGQEVRTRWALRRRLAVLSPQEGARGK